MDGLLTGDCSMANFAERKIDTAGNWEQSVCRCVASSLSIPAWHMHV